MGILWSSPESLSVREVHERLAADRDLAYTTVMTVLDRLAKKGLATRHLDGRAWLYRPSLSQVDAVTRVVIEELAELAPPARRAVLAAVARQFS